MKKLIFIMLLLAVCSLINGQRLRIEGFVLDAQTGIPLPDAVIKVDEDRYLTDIRGRFSFYHPAGSLTLHIKYGGYEEMKSDLTVRNDTTLMLYYDKLVSIEEIRVTGSRKPGFKRDSNIEITGFAPAEVSFLPVIGSGEDLLKKIQYLPGVQSGGEGSAGLIVRGGQYDQNLFNLNGFPVYQPFHFSGLISAIDPFMVSEVEVMKGGFPARYGGKLSSVVNFNTGRSVSDTVLTSVSAGLLVSGAGVAFSPDSVTTVAVAGRIGTTKFLNKTLNRSFPDFPFFDFHDLNLYASRDIGNDNDLCLTLYFNRDKLEKYTSYTEFDDDVETLYENRVISGWKDMLAGISWTNKPDANKSITTRLFFQDFLSESGEEIHLTRYEEETQTEDAINTTSSRIKELGFNSTVAITGKVHNLEAGIFTNLRSVKPVIGTFIYTNGELVNRPAGENASLEGISQLEAGAYIEDRITFNDRFTLRPGIRLTLLSDLKSAYFLPEPRLLASFKVREYLTLMGAYTLSSQSIHTVSSSNVMAVNDVWIPSYGNIKPSRTQQVEAGAFFNPGTFFRGEVNLFLKSSRDIYMYREGASFVLYPRWEDNIIPVTGLGYGAEFLLQAELHKTYALLTYTLSKTTRQSPEINNGERFDHKYDRPHDFRLSLGYKINHKLSISGSFVMQSGTVFSFYDRIIQGDLPFLERINNIRFPLYHRLDIGLERKTSARWGRKTFRVDIYNAYSKMNPWYLTLDNGELQQVTLFPIIPSVSYKIEF
ncbi:MAG: TonB-dependent receptor [Bacteroidales bacterium]|nr:TonB-dependent receptor [Bacteroidales bacterium]